jgi:SAM-dependent methyltransferase
MKSSFDRYATRYDSWFMKNRNILYSELKLVAYFLNDADEILSVGCGSGLFEMLLRQEYNITVKYGIEPSKSMAEIAVKRGMIVKIATAEDADFDIAQYNTILFNGTAGYVKDLQKIFNKAYDALPIKGKIVVVDIPKESSYALLYNLAKVLGKWTHPLLEGAHPADPYPIEFVKIANWRTTSEKINILKNAGFTDFAFAQTLTWHPVYSDNAVEEPKEGYNCGDYVAICAYKNK